MGKRVFASKKIFQAKAEEYFLICEEKQKLANVAGFCRWMDISRDTYYAQQDLYSDTFKKIDSWFEDSTLNNKDIAVPILAMYLKNKCGYKDNPNDTGQTVKVQIIDDIPEVTSSD